MIDLAALLARGRAAHEALMTDQIRLVRPGTPAYDSATGATPQPDPRVLYAGPARVKPAQAVEEDAQAGERLVVLRRYEIALPYGALPAAAERVLDGDQVQVVTSLDPRMAGLTLWVTSGGYSATATAWRLNGEDRS